MPGLVWNLVPDATEPGEASKPAFMQRVGIRPRTDPHRHHGHEHHASHPLEAREPTTEDTSSVPRPRFGKVGYGYDILHCTEPGKVALTFDDGPGIYTEDLLDLLARNNVKATFFIVGNSPDRGEISNPRWSRLMHRMHAEGHQLGSHSWSHADFSVSTPAKRRSEVIMNERAFIDVMGFFPTYFRPPYTRCPADCIAELGALGYHVVGSLGRLLGVAGSRHPLSPARLLTCHPQTGRLRRRHQRLGRRLCQSAQHVPDDPLAGRVAEARVVLDRARARRARADRAWPRSVHDRPGA